MDRVVGALASYLDEDVAEQERINCHHNFTQRERHFGREVWVSRTAPAVSTHARKRAGPSPSTTFELP